MFTILGAQGFIGSHLVAHLRAAGAEVTVPDRNDPMTSPSHGSWGHIIYCIGLTADFRTRLFDTMEAHVSRLLDVLRAGRYDSLLYLSSSRVYGTSSTGKEDDPIPVVSQSKSDLYNISKLAGEALCLTADHPGLRVARLSNVYGDDWSSQNFLTDLLRDAIQGRELEIGISPESAKDYIALDDVVETLPKIAAEGRYRLYNVASGQSVSNRALLDAICAETGGSWRAQAGAPDIAFPQIDVSRLTEEFHFQPASLLDKVPDLVALYRGSQHASGVARP